MSANKGPVACVVGWPVKHARSPIIHRYWLRQYGIPGDYVAEAVEPGGMPAFFERVRQGVFVGCNVTVPHKEAAFAAMDHVEPAGVATGAVNMVWTDGGKLIGTSSDGPGFLANLDERAVGWDREGGPAVVLGAGGAARAVLWALLSRGFAPIHLVNRTEGRAAALAEHFGPDVRPRPWSALSEVVPRARIIVNATSLGMAGQPALAVDLGEARRDCVVTDLVYVPLETGLLKAAAAQGLPAVDGLGMLLHQAVPGFERWFGRRPEVTPGLRSAVVADLVGKG